MRQHRKLNSALQKETHSTLTAGCFTNCTSLSPCHTLRGLALFNINSPGYIQSAALNVKCLYCASNKALVGSPDSIWNPLILRLFQLFVKHCMDPHRLTSPVSSVSILHSDPSGPLISDSISCSQLKCEGDQAFSIPAPRPWNSLSLIVKSSPDLLPQFTITFLESPKWVTAWMFQRTWKPIFLKPAFYSEWQGPTWTQILLPNLEQFGDFTFTYFFSL